MIMTRPLKVATLFFVSLDVHAGALNIFMCSKVSSGWFCIDKKVYKIWNVPAGGNSLQYYIFFTSRTMKPLSHVCTWPYLLVYISLHACKRILIVSDLVDTSWSIMVREVNQRQEDSHPAATFFNVVFHIPIFLVGKCENQVNNK